MLLYTSTVFLFTNYKIVGYNNAVKKHFRISKILKVTLLSEKNYVCVLKLNISTISF